MKLDKADSIFIWWMLKGKDVLQVVLYVLYLIILVVCMIGPFLIKGV